MTVFLAKMVVAIRHSANFSGILLHRFDLDRRSIVITNIT